MLTKIRIRYLSVKRIEITLIPSRLGRLFGFETRRGIARRERVDLKDEHGRKAGWIWGWYWLTTDRPVGWRIRRCIEAAPMPSIEELPLELLLGDGDSS